MSPFLAEFLGTMVLTLLGCGVVANVLLCKTKGSVGELSSGSGWLLICWGWAFAVAFGVYVGSQFGYGHINPMVTFGLASIGALPWSQVPIFMAGQFLGAGAGALLVYLAYLKHWREQEDPMLKLAVFCTIPQIRHKGANFLTEVIGSFMLMWGVLFVLEPAYEMKGLGPLVIGLLVGAIGMSLGGPTGFAINPARDFGPRIVHSMLRLPGWGKGGSDYGYAWVPIFGPLLGGVLGAVLWNVAWPH
jgi:glycerol uptake facilitator protein